MIPLTVVVLDELRNRPPEMAFAERDHTMETLVLERAHEPLRVGIRIGRLIRRLHDSESGLAQPRTHGRAPLGVPITDQHAMMDQQPVIRSRHHATACCINPSSGCGVDPTICTRREARSITNTV